MAARKPFLLRIDPATHAALQKWADDEFRSLNGHIEFLLRRALADAGRLSGGARRRTGRKQDGGGTEPDDR